MELCCQTTVDGNWTCEFMMKDEQRDLGTGMRITMLTLYFSAHAPIQTLYDLHRNSPECLQDEKFQVFVDGGIRRGTDVVKALCLGATAVGLGRPFIYAASGWGSDGVEKALMSESPLTNSELRDSSVYFWPLLMLMLDNLSHATGDGYRFEESGSD